MSGSLLPRPWLFVLLLVTAACSAAAAGALPGTRPLEPHDDRSREMVAGIDRFAMRELERSITARASLWNRDFSSGEAFSRSGNLNRERLRRIIGAVDERVPMTGVELVSTTSIPALLAETDSYMVYSVRWPVFENVNGEGLLLQPKRGIRARVVVLPDADQTPEMAIGVAPSFRLVSPLARQLAANGAQVVIPALIDRADEWSGSEQLNRFTNQPHREWIYRQAYEMGRHIIGYEVQKVSALLDWFAQENRENTRVPVGVAGYGEGALIALHAAALDLRIDATLVSGYFDSRQRIWEEPIYRNVFGLLAEFGDAELTTLIAPRRLVIEHTLAPSIDGPPAPRRGRSAAAAPGVVSTPTLESVRAEFARAESLCGPNFQQALRLCTEPQEAADAFWTGLGANGGGLSDAGKPPTGLHRGVDVNARQRRQVRELEAHTQELVRRSEQVRQQFFWDKLRRESADTWRVATSEFKTILWNDIFGRLPAADRPMNARTRVLLESRTWTAYEVVLDVWNDVFAWGYLLVPKGIRHGERRPVVVCQHGLEGLPGDTMTRDIESRAYGFYRGYAADLADRGFVVFSPHNPYRGRDEFRLLQRKLNPLGKTLYSVMIGQHGRILEWLSSLDFVDGTRIGFYGLSYGGKTAMRIPAIFARYAVSICSGDFNEWVRKNTAVDARFSYMFSGEYEMFEFNLGNTFNYAEMAALIAPRPFMVERGHFDAVAIDEWVSYEYAKVRRLYTELHIPERTAIEYFDGPHRINGVGTFDFLHTYLNWPKR